MKRKLYEKPTMHIVKLQHQGIICASQGQAGLQDYEYHDEVEESRSANKRNVWEDEDEDY